MKQRTGIEDYYIVKNNRKLRFGYTTGTCAAAAAKAAAVLLLTRTVPESVRIRTPKGIELLLDPVDPVLEEGRASCGIVKDAGDDPDITDGITVYASVELQEEGVRISGGDGVGLVTRKGLEQPVGEAAINAVPRRMIEEVLLQAAKEAGYGGGFAVTISAPEGRRIAEKTFNPKLGITGGISILGTSGIVEPMSERALISSLEVEMRQQLQEGRKDLVITLGNYGSAYLETLDLEDSVKCSNYVGEAVDLAVSMGAGGLLFVAHIGKFIKVAGGIMNTHSRNGDCRAELMAASALRAGAPAEVARALLDTITTDDAIQLLKEAGWLEQTMEVVCERIAYYLRNRSMGSLRTEALLFSNVHGYLGETKGFREYMEAVAADRKEGK